jgi:hypothetical protein
LSVGTGVAVREFATASGPVDYALFVDKRFCGAVEAKPAGTTLSGFSEQAARYIADAPDFLGADPRQRRFEYVASDTETLFRDLADPDPRSRRVFAFHRPETLRRWLSEPETLRARLQRLPPLVNDGLRQCQIEAIDGLEKSLARGDPRALIQMTMGAGYVTGAYCFGCSNIVKISSNRTLIVRIRRQSGQLITLLRLVVPYNGDRLFLTKDLLMLLSAKFPQGQNGSISDKVLSLQIGGTPEASSVVCGYPRGE